MNLVLLLIVVIVLFGLGGGCYGYSSATTGAVSVALDSS
jgi:hypothetical protein